MSTHEIPEEAVVAAAEAMYSQRPQSSDPKHWETPWEDVPEGWKQGQYRAARQVLEAAMPMICEQSRLTRKQAVIIGAYTGVIAGSFGDVHELAEQKLGRSIWTHEFANPELWEQLKIAVTDDFLSICYKEPEVQ